jgi:hypothetical protein
MLPIKCQDCGREISDYANRCPNCGCLGQAPQQKFVYRHKYIFLGLVIAVVALAGLMAVWMAFEFVMASMSGRM